MSAVASKKRPSRKAPPSGKGLTFEKVWALMQKNIELDAKRDAKRKEEFDRRMQELAEQEAKREAKQKKEFEQFKKKLAERETKWKEELAEREAKLKEELAAQEAKRKEELDRQMKEIAEEEAKRKKELDEQEAKRKEKLAEEEAKREEELAEKEAKREKELDRLERMIRRNGKQLGEVHHRFGQLAEHLVAPGIAKRFNELGYHFDLSAKGTKIHGENGKIKTEIDLFMENVKTIIAIEVKSRPVVQDVEHHIKRIEIIQDHYRGINDQRKILGGVAGAIYEEDVKNAVQKAGLFVIEQSGDTMKIDVPEGFIPREW
jgi:chromosome segregation ATPase